jgi:uncharacterized repeat protein (TIGR01451 family)
LLAFLSIFASAEDELFYTGSIHIDSIIADIVIDKDATISIEYALANSGNAKEQINLGFLSPSAKLYSDDKQLSNPVLFKAGEKKTIKVTYKSAISGEVTKTFSFNLGDITFNGKPNSNRCGEFVADIKLPKGIKKIIWSNKEPYGYKTDKNGFVVYTWQEADRYPTMLGIKWSTLDINLGVAKSASPEKITRANETIIVSIIVENNGNNELANVVLTDNYLPSEFEGVSPKEEFSIPQVNGSDPRLVWVKKIASLKPKERKTISYSLKYIGDVSKVYNFDLKQSVVTVDGHLAGVSNAVSIRKMVGVKELAKEPQKANIGVDYKWLTITALAIALIAIASILFLKKRKKQTKIKKGRIKA